MHGVIERTEGADASGVGGTGSGREPQPDERGSVPPQWPAQLIGAATVLLTGALRAVRLLAANQISVDEIFYMNLGHSARQGHVPMTFPPGEGDIHKAFLLHPPGFYLLEAAWEMITGRSADLIRQIEFARGLNVVLAMATAAILFLFGKRLLGLWSGAAAALLFAVDPFVLRQNGTVLLETATLMWTVAGFLVLVDVSHGRRAHPALVSLAGGLILGGAVATKDMAFIETAGALAVLWALGWGLPRKLSAIALVGTIVPYGAYVVSCAWQGVLGQLIRDKTFGIRRTLGLAVTTGFNKAGSPSLSSTLASQAGTYVFSYLLVAVGAVCGLSLLRSRRADFRILGVFTSSAAALLAYSVAFGTIEEQFLYFLMIPALLSAVVVLPGAARRLSARRWWRGGASAAVAAVLALVVAWNGAVWVHERVGSTNQLSKLTAWLDRNVPAHSTVAYGEGVMEFTLQSRGYTAVALGPPSTMAREHVRYFVVIPREVQQNYSFVKPDSLASYLRHSRVAFHSERGSPQDIEVLESIDGSW